MIKRRPTFPLAYALGVAAAACAVNAYAHHSIAAVYDSSKRVTVEGSVTEFHFVNPHPFLVIEVEQGENAGRWRLEMDNRWELAEIGIEADTFRPGDRVVCSGSAGRVQAHSAYLWRLDRPRDGLRYEQIGGTPRIDLGSGAN